MRVTYIGPYVDGAEIAATGQIVLPGESVEVSDELGAALCEQASNWTADIPKSKTKTAASAEEQVI